MVFLELAWLLVKAFVIFPLASLGALTIYESYLCQEGENFSLLFYAGISNFPCTARKPML